MLKFLHKVFCMMGKALTGKPSCKWTEQVILHQHIVVSSYEVKCISCLSFLQTSRLKVSNMASDEENKTNLIINYLPQALTDAEFSKMFLPMGPVKSIKICRDKATNYSYGFGFVDYKNPEDAQKAIDELNGKQVMNKKIKVALARPSGATIKGSNIYIKNIPKHYSDEKVQEVFSEYGTIIQTRVLRDSRTGESKTVGFILYDKKYEAEKAIDKMNGKTLPGGDTPLIVKFSGDERRMGQGNTSSGPRPMFYGGNPNARMMPPFNYNDSNQMEDLTGPMRNFNNALNRFRYNPMGQNPASQNTVFNPNSRYNPNYYVDAYSDDVNPDPHRQSSGGYCLFIHNVGFDCQQRDLYKLFAPYGALLKVDVVWDKEKDQCKGYAFVTFVNGYEAANAVNMLNGSWYNGRQLQVSFKK